MATCFHLLRLIVMLVVMSVFIAMFKIPFLDKFLMERMKKYDYPGLKDLDIRPSFAMMRERFWPIVYDTWLREAQVGAKVKDTELFNPTTKSMVSLLSFQQSGRPLVLNFGSCT